MIRVSPRTAVVLAVAAVLGLAMVLWPLLINAPQGSQAHAADAPLLLLIILPMLLMIVLAEMSTGGLDAKALAMLGVLSAVNAALRPLGAGTGGIETVFFLLILAGRVFGPGFGFVLGSTSLFTSALLTAGVGPWLPFQMLSSSLLGLGAGLLPHRPRGRWEVIMLAGYGVLAAYFFGFVMNLSFWPFLAGTAMSGTTDGLEYVPVAPILDNLGRFVVYSVVTSALGWDTGRALTNMVAILLVGPAVLAVLRRTSRRAAFDAPVVFDRPLGD